jgi:hypothetical protein
MGPLRREEGSDRYWSVHVYWGVTLLALTLESELHYDWWFTANQFVLATSSLRLTTRDSHSSRRSGVFCTTWTTYKNEVQRLLYCCVCIGCGGKMFIEPLPSNDFSSGSTILAFRRYGGVHRQQGDLISLHLFFNVSKVDCKLLYCP